MATVKATQSHYGSNGMITAGTVYDVPDNVAAELKRAGLVEYDGPAAPAKKVEHVLVSDKKESLGAEKVEKEEVKEKAVIVKPVTRKK